MGLALHRLAVVIAAPEHERHPHLRDHNQMQCGALLSPATSREPVPGLITAGHLNGSASGVASTCGRTRKSRGASRPAEQPNGGNRANIVGSSSPITGEDEPCAAAAPAVAEASGHVILASTAAGELTYPCGCGGADIDHGLTAGDEPPRQVLAKTTCIFDGPPAFGIDLARGERAAGDLRNANRLSCVAHPWSCSRWAVQFKRSLGSSLWKPSGLHILQQLVVCRREGVFEAWFEMG